jgi:hypothetical protein
MVLFIATIFSVYYADPGFNKLFFFVLLVPMWFSKKNYFWITFFILICSSPLQLFSTVGAEIVHKIPVYNIIGGYGVDAKEIIVVLFFFKAIFRGNNNKLLIRHYSGILILLFFLVFISFIQEMDLVNFVKQFRSVLYFTLFYSIPKLTTTKDFEFMFRVFALFTIIHLADQVVSLVFGVNASDLIAGTQKVEKFLIDAEYKRIIVTILPQFMVIVFGLASYNSSNPIMRKNMLITFIAIAFFSIFLTGTRGWILGILLVFAYFLVAGTRNRTKPILIIFIFALLFYLVIVTIPQVNTIFNSTIERLMKLGSLAEGDITAGGTLARLNQRLPMMMPGIQKSPIIGWGFTNTFVRYHDIHVGWANQWLQMGLVGIFIFIYFIVRFWVNNVKLGKRLSTQNPFKQSMKILNGGLLCLLVVHMTTRCQFNFTLGTSPLMLTITYFIFTDMWMRKSYEEESDLRA